ncbi:MAG: glucose 1-dehydrogenase [Chloroflexi bacterium]|nr:glucose 1-dehydrogenase [Chloroflexota bacterium]
MKLQDRVVIITGAVRGIGQVLAQRVAEQGARVVAADILDVTETAQKVNAVGGRAIGLRVDVTRFDSVREMADETLAQFGQIDALVNNAALSAALKPKPFDAISENEWDAVFAVNVKGIWQCCKAVVPCMKRRGGGSIINISSDSIFQGIPLLTHYVASKGAVWAFTRSLARELGESGIRVNSITPGYTITGVPSGLSEDKQTLDHVNDLNIEQRVLKRAMTPDDLTGAVVFLASDDSAFISGQNLNVDGGAVHY